MAPPLLRSLAIAHCLVAGSLACGEPADSLNPADTEAGSSTGGDESGGSTGAAEGSTGSDPECRIDSDCGDDQYCSLDDRCEAKGALDDACLDDEMCLDPWVCVIDHCAPPQPLGAACGENDDCEAVCSEGLCQTPCVSGCDEDTPCCDPGSFCFDPPGFDPRYCRPAAAEGEWCDGWNHASCQAGLYCTSDACTPRLPAGANCDYTDHWPECLEGLTCDLGRVPHPCVPE